MALTVSNSIGEFVEKCEGYKQRQTEHLNLAALHLAGWKTKDNEICLNCYGTLSMPDFESNLSSKIKTF